ncbi:hypothetical protein [Burkholderia plantarii]|uniref:hypothetical protein n=1 Tax=Burkholderia plantarii TaxID=41899 RepID=UPI0018DB89B0|nr:hypothetical protein [Burkholderia plantarii]MBI0330098.1 hypothetical protein [Burkholderia plantarii]
MANQAVVAGGAFVGNSHCRISSDYGATSSDFSFSIFMKKFGKNFPNFPPNRHKRRITWRIGPPIPAFCRSRLDTAPSFFSYLRSGVAG